MSRKIAAGEGRMQAKAAFVFSAAVRQHSVYAKIAVGMRRDYIKWYSPSLHRDMELLAFGERTVSGNTKTAVDLIIEVGASHEDYARTARGHCAPSQARRVRHLA